MTIETDAQGNHILVADEGRAIHQRGTPSPCSTVRARLAPNLDPATWEDCEFGEPEPPPAKYSTLSIKRELAALGRWEAAKQLIEASGAWDDYILANYLAEGDPVFVAARMAFVERGILTQEELDELLPKCLWTAD